MSRERAQAMASCQLASVGSETTGETVRSENAGLYYLGPREPLSYTSNGRSVWDSKEASVLERISVSAGEERIWYIRFSSRSTLPHWGQ